MKRLIRASGTSRTYIVDDTGWHINGNAISLPVYRDDGVYICNKNIGKSCIISQTPCGAGRTAFEIEDWVCKKNLSPGFQFGYF